MRKNKNANQNNLRFSIHKGRLTRTVKMLSGPFPHSKLENRKENYPVFFREPVRKNNGQMRKWGRMTSRNTGNILFGSFPEPVRMFPMAIRIAFSVLRRLFGARKARRTPFRCGTCGLTRIFVILRNNASCLGGEGR